MQSRCALYVKCVFEYGHVEKHMQTLYYIHKLFLRKERWITQVKGKCKLLTDGGKWHEIYKHSLAAKKTAIDSSSLFSPIYVTKDQNKLYIITYQVIPDSCRYKLNTFVILTCLWAQYVCVHPYVIITLFYSGVCKHA